MRAVAVVLSLAWLAACQADSSPAPTHLETVHLAVYLPQFVEMGVTTGRLTTRRGCLFIESDRGVTYGVGWPAEFTTWDPLISTITVRQGRARVGDEVAVGGGTEEISPAEIGNYRWARPPRPDCLGDEFLFAATLEGDPD